MKANEHYLSSERVGIVRFMIFVFFIFVLVTSGFSQQKSVKGVVTDESGSPIPGATISVKGTSTGTITDQAGRFTIGIPLKVTALSISFVGMITQEIKLGSQTVFSIKMRPENVQLDEVVAIGYGVQRKKLVTGVEEFLGCAKIHIDHLVVKYR